MGSCGMNSSSPMNNIQDDATILPCKEEKKKEVPISELECTRCGSHGTPTLYACATCMQVLYCSQTCQSQDWRWHRPICLENKKMDSKRELITKPDSYLDVILKMEFLSKDV